MRQLLTNEERRQSTCTHGKVQREVCAHRSTVEERVERRDTDEPSLFVVRSIVQHHSQSVKLTLRSL